LHEMAYLPLLKPKKRCATIIFRSTSPSHCRISPPRFLAECRKRRLNQGSFVLLFFFRLSALFDLYLVFVCLFSCTALFVSISQVIGCEDRLRNDLLCVGWGVKLYSLTDSPSRPNKAGLDVSVRPSVHPSVHKQLLRFE